MWTTGYVVEAELVFIMRGMHPGVATMSRRRWRTDFHKHHVWAPNSDIHAIVEAPEMTVEERQELARRADQKAAKKRAKRERQRARKTEQPDEPDADAMDQEAAREAAAGQQASAAFDSLLMELKLEEEAAKADGPKG